MTTADSDKKFKSTEHRRERQAVSAALNTEQAMPHERQFGDP